MPEEQQITRLIEVATLAPSSHNPQPWIFEQVGVDRIRLQSD